MSAPDLAKSSVPGIDFVLGVYPIAEIWEVQLLQRRREIEIP